MTFLDTILEELLKIFKKNGINAYKEEELIKLLDIRSSTFKELFPNKVEMVNKVIRYNNEVQKREHEELLSVAHSAVEEIILLLKHGIKEIQTISPQYIHDLQQHFPEAWQIGTEHLSTYSYYQLFDIINKGILEGHFRKDINIQIVVKIILEQIYLVINPVSFPPEKFDMSEVFRSIYMYYIRGLCTDAGSKVLEEVFATSKI